MPGMPQRFPVAVSIPRRSGWAALAVFAAFLAVGVASRAGSDLAVAGGGALLGLAGGVVLFVTRARAALVGAAVAGAGVLLAGNADARDVGWFALLVVVAWVVLAGGVRLGLACWAAGVAVFASEWVWAVRDPGWGPWTAGLTVTALAMVAVRHQMVLVDALRAAQASLAERSATEERNRIARDIHDVLAHCLTVSLLHISAARLAIETDPADATRALAEAERLARQSLDEVRATMGLLGSPPTTPGVAPPVPDASQVPELVGQLRRAGAEITMVVDGDLATVPAITGSALYRIAQEALTNAARHANACAIEVRVDITAERVELDVDSNGPPGQGTGMGLDSMRERAIAAGGTCSGGPYRNGWRVRARLPVSAAPQALEQ